MKRKPATRVFQHFPRWRSGHAEPIRRSVGTRPRSETTRTRRQRKENAIRVDSRRFAVGYLMCPYITRTRTRRTPKKRDPDLAYFTSSKDSAADEPPGNRYDPNK